MGLIKRKMKQIIRWAFSDEDYPSDIDYNSNKAQGKRKSSLVNSLPVMVGANSIEEDNRGMNFTVYSATGGKIVQLRTYDPSRDRTSSTLYIIHQDEDLGEQLAHIITVESLTR